jgi:UDP-glucose 4-epimerase
VVRLRPGLIFKRDAASEIRRYFAGPLLPNALMRHIPVVPDTPRLRFQAVHSLDIGDAYRRAVVDEAARGAYNVAAEPVLDPERLASLLGARRVKVPARVLRAAAALTWRARLQPTPEGWLDMALGVPIMDTTRAREELGWEPRHDGGEALLELLGGMADGDGLATPPLHAGGSRLRELAQGVGARL